MRSLTIETLKIYWQHAKKYKWHVFGILFGMVGHVILHNYNPILFKKIIDSLDIGGSKTGVQPAIGLVFVMLGVSLARAAFARGLNFQPLCTRSAQTDLPTGSRL